MNAFLQLLLLFTTLTTKPFNVDETHDKFFRVYFEQDHKIIEAVGDDVFLKKEPFDVVLEFPEPMGVLVHASLNPETYDDAVKGKSLKKLPGFENTGMAESMFNTDNEIMLSNTAPNYWFYDNDDAHRFDAVESSNGKITCKRRVVQFTDVDSNRVIKLSDVEQPLNLVFISTEQTEGSDENVELNRVAVRVNWDD
jgi:hypothetical protein